MIELLAPAGDIDKLKFALLYGADAVYIGGQNYSLRANAKNFSINAIKEACAFAHSIGKKVYVTVNIVLHNEDVPNLLSYLKELSTCNVDAVIVSDVGVMNLIKENNLPLEIHVSTQASITNDKAGLFYKNNFNAKRLVLARETSKEDIKRIKDATNLDLECFVHGAMCTAISGRCVLSNELTLRDANRGGCAQICRWEFIKDGNTYSISSKDLNMIPYIKEMIEVGVNSFKVEGRMRGIYYIAVVINAYRHIIDGIKNNTLTEQDKKYYLAILNRVANRDSTPQFFKGVPGKEGEYFLGRQEESNQDFLGLVLDYDKETKLATIEERNLFSIGDKVSFFGPNLEEYTTTINEIFDEDDNHITTANKPKMIVKVRVDAPLSRYDMMHIKVFDKKDFI